MYNTIIKETERFINDVIQKKYLLTNETCYDDIINKRFYKILKKIEKNPDKFSNIIRLLLEKKMIPSGSILFGLGNTEFSKLTLSNCYYIPIEEDSIEGIYDARKKIALTFSRRGGVGTSLSILRPKNSLVNNASKSSSGSVSFASGFSNLAHDIGQSGRRGALLLDIDCRHPDVLDFIWSKAKPQEIFESDSLTGHQPNISHANISIQLTNKFMNAVENDLDWALWFPDISCKEYNKWDGNFDKWELNKYPIKVHQIIKAKDILMQISEAAWLTGDPGILFRDYAQKYSTGYFDPKLIPVGVNPCGEQWLQNYGNCLLTAFVLHKYVEEPYTKNAQFDMESFLTDIQYCVYFLNHIIDINQKLHVLPEQRKTDEYSRRMGIELTGIHDTLAMLNLDYGSQGACDFIEDLLFSKNIEEIKISIKLAKETESAPCLKSKKSRQAFLKQPYIKRLLNKLIKGNKELIEENVMKYGLKNSAFNTIGPTGSISIIADNCSSGGEPIFGIEYNRETRLTPGKLSRIIHLPLAKHVGPKILDLTEEEIKKKYHYTIAHEIDYKDRIKMQSVIQQLTDSSISSTINLKNDVKIEDIFKIYMMSWKKELKGVTVFRDGCKKGVLSAGVINEKQAKSLITSELINKHLALESNELNKTHRAYRYIKFWKKTKIYITVTINSEGLPIEIFANIPYSVGIIENGTYQSSLLTEKKSYWDAICRLVSLMLRMNTPLELIISQLKKSSPTMLELPNIIAHVLKGFLNYSDEKIEDVKKNETGEYCDLCKKNGIIYQGGCSVCLLCGDSKCG